MARGRGRLRKSLTLSGLVPLVEEDFGPASQNALPQNGNAIDPIIPHGDITRHCDRDLGRARDTHASDRPALPVAPAGRGVLHMLDFGHLEEVAGVDHESSITQLGLNTSLLFVFFLGRRLEY